MLGDDHPDTLISIGAMGALLQAQGRLADAEPYYREALAGLRRVLGDDHPDTLTSINNMGFLLRSQGRLAEAELYYREVLEIRQGVLSGASGGGWIRYRPPGAIARIASGKLGFDVMLSALENFRYEWLELTLDGDTHGIVQIGLHLRGVNPEYQGGRPVEFNLNLESELVDLLRRESAAYSIPASIERRLAEITAGLQ